jgi:hypothetical protein
MAQCVENSVFIRCTGVAYAKRLVVMMSLESLKLGIESTHMITLRAIGAVTPSIITGAVEH